MVIDEQQWQRFSIDGFLHLGRVLTGPELEALRERAGELAAGTLHNDRVVMALEGGGEAASAGAHGYRQIQGLEHDDVFRSLVAHPLFLEVCARMYAPHAAVSVFSATVLNEPGGQTAATPWRQNGGSAWQLDRDPLVTIWVALDDATIANGCVEAVRGSHRNGLLSADGGALSEQETELYCDPEQVVALELPCGHAVLLHSWLIHRAAANASSQSRRAFAGCYLDGRTINISTGQHYAVVAGTVDQSPYPFIGQLERDRSAFAERLRVAEAQVGSLEAELAALGERLEPAETTVPESEDNLEPPPTPDRLTARAANWLRSLRH